MGRTEPKIPQALLNQGTPQLMTQRTPCAQQTGTFTSAPASAQALGEEGGGSNEQLLLLLLPLTCSEHTGAQGAETKHPVLPDPAGCSQSAKDSWTLLEEQRHLRISTSPPAAPEGAGKHGAKLTAPLG